MYNGIFQSTDQIYRNYAKASQAGTVRLDIDHTPAAIEGLCTDGLSACLGIVIISQDRRKISLTHTDLGVSEQALFAECQWVGEHATMFISRGIHYRSEDFERRAELQTKTLPRIKKALTVLSVEIDLTSSPIPVWALAVNREGKITPIPEQTRIGFTDVNMELRHSINMLNADTLASKGSYHPLDLQYDAKAWTNFPQLIEDALTLVKHRHNSSHVDAYNEYFTIHFERMLKINSEATKSYTEQRFDKALQLFEQALRLATQIQLDHFPQYQNELAALYANLGSVHKNLKNYDQASYYLENAIKLREVLYGKDCQQAKKCIDKLNEIYELRRVEHRI